MRKLVAALAAAVPLAASAQPVSPESAPPAAAPTQPAPPPQGQYAPPPQVAPPPPQYAPAPQYPPPPPQYAPPPAQPAYAPPPQHAAPPQGQVVQASPQYPQGYPPPPQYAPPAPPPQAAALRPSRSAWYAAFSVGGGDGNIRLPATAGQAAGTYSLHDWFGKGPTTFAFDLDVGATLTPHLLLGGELTVFAAAATYQTPYGEASSGLGMSNLNAVLTFYPWERGLFLRGGAGLATITSTVEVRGPAGKTKTTDSARGGDLALGAGYAFWLGQRFNLSLNLDWSRQFFGANDVKGASFWRLGLGFGWY